MRKGLSFIRILHVSSICIFRCRVATSYVSSLNLRVTALSRHHSPGGRDAGDPSKITNKTPRLAPHSKLTEKYSVRFPIHTAVWFTPSPPLFRLLTNSWKPTTDFSKLLVGNGSFCNFRNWEIWRNSPWKWFKRKKLDFHGKSSTSTDFECIFQVSFRPTSVGTRSSAS